MISILMPCYNEDEVLLVTYEKLIEAANEWDEPFEWLLVDDGSRDDTWAIIEMLAERDDRIRGVRLSRNFGHQAAIGAGLAKARGDAVIVMDADLQDPPGLVPEMLLKWREGNQIVYAQRTRREGESFFKKIAGHCFYRLLDRLTDVPIPRDSGDFALLDRSVIRQLRKFKEHDLFWRGLRSWTGFKQTAVLFERPPRAGGESKYTLRKLIQLAAAGIFSFSKVPLRLGFYLGGTTLLATAAFGLLSLVFAEWLLSPTVFAVLAIGGLQLLCMGLMGEYMNRMYDELRGRPRWVVEQTTRHGISRPKPRKRKRKALDALMTIAN